MNEITTPTPEVHEHKGKPTTTSLNIAKVFGKQHKHVIASIRNLEIPEEFSRTNFGLRDFKCPRGKTYPMYEISRDGFTLLVMGFTGAKAMQFKLAYIAAFNAMEAELSIKHMAQGPGNPCPIVQRLLVLQEEMIDLYRFKVATLEQEPLTTSKRRAFSEEENRIVFEMWQDGASNRQIAHEIGRKVESVATKTRALRLASRTDSGVTTLSLQVSVQGELS